MVCPETEKPRKSGPPPAQRDGYLPGLPYPCASPRGRRPTAEGPSVSQGSATTSPWPPTGSIAPTGCVPQAGWTYPRSSTPSKGPTTPSPPRSPAESPKGPSWTSEDPSPTGGTRDLKAKAPTFKKKKATGTGSFLAASGVAQLRYNGKRRIQLLGLGSVKLACTLPKGIPYEARIKRENGRWMLSILYWKEPEPKPKPDHRRRGAADTGINPLGTDSDGEVFPNPKAYYSQERKLRRWQRAQSRRKKGSRGWWEAQRKIDKCHRRIKGLRRNAAHQMTNTLTRKFKHLVIEDLNVSGMMQGPTPKAQADSAMGEIRRQLEYKCRWRHTVLIKAHRLFPSSKICHVCHHPNAKLKRERWWTCPNCGAGNERNQNAAVNLGRLTLPPGRGPMLRDGKALASAPRADETGPVERRTAQLTLWG